MDTFQAYKDFNAIRLHFTSKYDYFKYHGKTRVTWNSFEKFSGKKTLHNILRKHQSDFIEYVATCFAYDKDISWVGDLNSATAEENWLTHRKNMGSLTRIYTTEISDLFRDRSAKEVLMGDDNLPLIEKNRISGLTSMETCCILDQIFDYINKNKCTHPLWEDTIRIKKYTPFLEINLQKFIDITKSVML